METTGQFVAVFRQYESFCHFHLFSFQAENMKMTPFQALMVLFPFKVFDSIQAQKSFSLLIFPESVVI